VGKIGIFVERYTMSDSEVMNALMRIAQISHHQGHRTEFIFRPDMWKIPEFDAIYIRAITDPLNSAYVTSRIAELNGIKVVDDSESIRICCDKVNMYTHLIKAGVKIPETRFIKPNELTWKRGKELLAELGKPLVLKAPNSSFSMYVDRASTPQEFLKIGKKYLRRADRLVVQKYVKSEFDWRVGVLGGEPIYVCQYTIPRRQWKVSTYTQQGREIYGPVRGVPLKKASPNLINTALEAAAAIGKGLYGVDLKQVGDDFIVIEVNDNPTIAHGEEDQEAPDIYQKIIKFLLAK
jgi:glutathione synthase/RimK-type ligase-like ATP-grasp enzyme